MIENKTISVAFLTLGCKVNYYETEKMAEQFRAKGFQIREFSEKADLYVVNTCTVTNVADRKSRQMLHRAKKMNPESLVVAVGCYVESAGDTILQDSSVDAAFSNKDKENIVDKILEKFEIHVSGTCNETDAGGRKERTRAYLKIQDGCNQFCSYCLIPYVRGGGILSSTPASSVVKKVQELVEQGYKEVVLTGIHLSSYGIDRSKEINFVKLQGRPLLELIQKLSEISGLKRIRLGSLEPRVISESFLKELAKIKKLCPHFHLSLQSGCDTVLGRMNRHYTTGEYREKVELLRKYFENPAITTDVIVGFPGETDEEFEQTRRYLEKIRLADIHVFKYSPRSGTKAAEMEEQIAPEKKNMRSDILLADAGKYRSEYSLSFLNTEENVLFEEVVSPDGEKYLMGHNERYVKIGVPLGEAEKNGYKENEIYKIKVTKVFC